MRKRMTITGLFISLFVLILSSGLTIYTFFISEIGFEKGILGLFLFTVLLFWINWINYMKFKKEERSNLPRP